MGCFPYASFSRPDGNIDLASHLPNRDAEPAIRILPGADSDRVRDSLPARFHRGTVAPMADRLLRCISLLSLCVMNCLGAGIALSEDAPLTFPPVGSYELRIITPSVLELTLVTKKDPDPAKSEAWNFVNNSGQGQLPVPGDFFVSASGKSIPIKAVGFKRRALYAPLKQRDLRVGNYLYLQLVSPIPDNQTVKVENPGKKLWAPPIEFVAKSDALRWSPVIHVNQTGYLPNFPKKAHVGYYLGSLGELDLASDGKTEPVQFQIIDAASGKPAHTGTLAVRRDKGFPYDAYQRVLEADFSDFKTEGDYKLLVPGLGASSRFFINEGVAAAFARTYALGIYHQRCGTANDLPFTRYTHKECHVAPAAVPDMSRKFESANESLKKETANYKDNPRHTAPPLKSMAASLYPFQNKGPVDVRGGHHDAGDYSKYTINSASFIHQLVFAVDVFPGVAELDNLGLPESGDGKSDILQEAKWEADFLAKMQDADGGFYFLVYPREREYEFDVTPEHGDPQIVFPKTTSATAAATAALAQCASSPTFKKQFPEAAALYLEKAKKGWAFLEKALAKH